MSLSSEDRGAEKTTTNFDCPLEYIGFDVLLQFISLFRPKNTSASSSAGASSKFRRAAMTESESSFQEAISRAAAVSVSQGLLCSK
jgi:hypothetical protein